MRERASDTTWANAATTGMVATRHQHQTNTYTPGLQLQAAKHEEEAHLGWMMRARWPHAVRIAAAPRRS